MARPDPIAVRELRLTDDGRVRRVRVRIWAPVPYGEDWACPVAVDGLDEPIRTEFVGVDSLQALIITLVALRSWFEPYGERIAWLDEPGEHGIPYQLTMPTPEAERRIVERVRREIDAEMEAQLEPHRRREAELRERYDPDAATDWNTAPSGDVLRALHDARLRERTECERGNRDAAAVFSSKQFMLVGLLRARPDYRDTLATLCADDDPRLRFLAADALHPETAVTLYVGAAPRRG